MYHTAELAKQHPSICAANVHPSMTLILQYACPDLFRGLREATESGISHLVIVSQETSIQENDDREAKPENGF